MSRLYFSLLFAALAAASHAVLSNFDLGAEGWQTCNLDVVSGLSDDFATPDWLSGDDGHTGSLLTGDVAGFCFYTAPAKFLGAQSAAFGSTLSFDTYAPDNDGAVYPAVALRSGSTLLFHNALPPGKSWSTTSIPLTGSEWSLSPTENGSGVSDDQLQSVLGNLDGLFIQADWYFKFEGADTTGLDNVRLGAVPEPASLAALGLGAAATVRRRKGARK